MCGDEEGEWPGVDDAALGRRVKEDDEGLGKSDSGRISGMPTIKLST